MTIREIITGLQNRIDVLERENRFLKEKNQMLNIQVKKMTIKNVTDIPEVFENIEEKVDLKPIKRARHSRKKDKGSSEEE